RFPFDHPVYILYSSGTTGAPKCIVHGAGGTLLQHLKEHQLHSDLRPGDHLFYFTTTGWMMWNWLVSGLASGATLALYDGSPFHPTGDVLWNLAERTRLTHFGASAKYFAHLEKQGAKPREHHDLTQLRVVLSTGSPLLPESYDYIYRDVKADVCLSSISGGTDLISCFALGCPTEPVRRGELQVKGLGMDVHVFNDDGKPIIGEPGELVCTSPFPSMPVGFWNDPDKRKYLGSYFSAFDNVWTHGDWAEETPTGGLVIYGRSDTTLNPGGVRIGTAEIYQQVEAFPEVVESLATALRRGGDERVVLFVRMQPGQSLTPELTDAIKQRLKTRCSPRHVPAFVVAAPDFPRTISGKLSEVAVRNAVNGLPIKNTGALANPDALDFFRTLQM
ncbi:MAG TPA: acetoacetate--CoA ligase, partial [Fimbriiglobus sp.]|nr:acetoacetate--CoA ligase [Fimbriiglobus sp.]